MKFRQEYRSDKTNTDFEAEKVFENVVNLFERLKEERFESKLLFNELIVI